MHDKILILDFGSQVTQLIARRVREAKVYCEIHPCDVSDEFVRAYGAKGVIEGWLNITPKAWAALDGSYTAAHSGYAAKLRIGYRFMPDLSIGFEESATGNVAFDDWRDSEIERLNEERRKLDEMRAEFEDDLRELRRAKDQEEFDRFMAKRNATRDTGVAKRGKSVPDTKDL